VGLPNSHYLIHQPLSGIRGVATEIEIHARELEKLRARINRLIADETGAPFEQVEKDTDRDYWMNAEEAIKYGLISQVVEKRVELKLPAAKEDPPPRVPAEKPAAKKASPKKSAEKPGTKTLDKPDKKKTGKASGK
jgi:ATP-dependent Clp protease protease subunit